MCTSMLYLAKRSKACVIATVKLQYDFCVSPVWAVVYVVTFCTDLLTIREVQNGDSMEPILDCTARSNSLHTEPPLINFGLIQCSPIPGMKPHNSPSQFIL